MKIINIFRNFFFLIFFNLKFLFFKKKKLEPNHKLDRPLIVSLTSKKNRFHFLHLTLMSLFNQKTLPDKIILWIDKNEKKFLNNRLTSFVKFGLEINFCENYRSYNKIYNLLKKNSDNYIITFDDDIIYHNESITKLVDTSLSHTEDFIVSNRIHQIKFNKEKICDYNAWLWNSTNHEPSIYNFQTGVYGVLYPPNSFYHDVSIVEKFMKLSPYADDIWLYWMIRLNNKKVIWSKFEKKNYNIFNFKDDNLQKINVGNKENDKQIMQMINHYGFPK